MFYHSFPSCNGQMKENDVLFYEKRRDRARECQLVYFCCALVRVFSFRLPFARKLLFILSVSRGYFMPRVGETGWNCGRPTTGKGMPNQSQVNDFKSQLLLHLIYRWCFLFCLS